MWALSAATMKSSYLQYVFASASVGFLVVYCLGYWMALNSSWEIVGVVLYGAGLYFVFANIAFLCIHIIGAFFYLCRGSRQGRKHLVSASIIAIVLALYYVLIYDGVYLSA